jgi:hypothetical protein
MSDLPVRDLASAHLAELIVAGGCPGCHERRRVVERYTEAYLYESVNDVRFRADLDAARGMCGEHVREMLRADRRRSGGMLGPAILLDAMLRVREAELQAATGAPGPLRSRRVKDASRPPACPVCSEAAGAVRGTLGHLVRLTHDPQWADAVAHSDVCLEHLAAMMATPERPRGWSAVERSQLERLASLRARLIDYADHSAHDRRHLATQDERDAVDDAAGYLGGAEDARTDGSAATGSPIRVLRPRSSPQRS